jgi:TPR repeat protein
MAYEEGKGGGAWYRKALQFGRANAADRLGNLYQYVRGVGRDIAEAGRRYEMAASLVSTTAARALSQLDWLLVLIVLGNSSRWRGVYRGLALMNAWDQRNIRGLTCNVA